LAPDSRYIFAWLLKKDSHRVVAGSARAQRQTTRRRDNDDVAPIAIRSLADHVAFHVIGGASAATQ
jgi:hypothetical protein